jgi:transposase
MATQGTRGSAAAVPSSAAGEVRHLVGRPLGNLRRHHLDAPTTRLAKSHGIVVVEDLNVRGMSRSARGTVEEPGRHVRAKAGLNRDLNATRNLVWWASVAQDVAGSAPETQNARREATAIRPAAGEGSAEASTGVVPEPTAPSGVVAS